MNIDELQAKKLETEINKLKSEAPYAKAALIGQFASPLVLIVIAFMTLWLYQRPQNEQTELNRKSAEEAKIVDSMAGAFALSDRKSRLEYLKFLQVRYREHAVIATAVKNAEEDLQQYNKEQQEIRISSQSSGRYAQDECRILLQDISLAQEKLRQIGTQNNATISGRQSTFESQGDLAASTVDSRVTYLENEIKDIRARRIKLKC